MTESVTQSQWMDLAALRVLVKSADKISYQCQYYSR